ncbi:MAG: hypothetical protein ACREU8_10280 [Gammaproteobacteria bacterium]
MINCPHARFHRPEEGWDPVPLEHAVKYGAGEWQAVNDAVLDELEQWIGGFGGKRILDLGGAPGQYSIAFAKRGGEVTWHEYRASIGVWHERKGRRLPSLTRFNFLLGVMACARG